ncbi:hypothetical protein KIN20_034221 [Parelaphostrongylus tenuis]|uniref:Uncharacterized protein n=1 Tax=Parelaphostrongylus tenuis TaxID=148309 RepID=A0AAD5WJ23_PARTN|nr:hypothetical protein KIN20_034221 [Parelaphostrongylus tenuis]
MEKLSAEKITNCTLNCEFDKDCAGLKRCCRVGCSNQCFYPIRTTPCLNAALTAELYGLPNMKRCDENGQFEQIQCNDDVCFCVDIANGEELPGTRIANDTPNCKEDECCMQQPVQHVQCSQTFVEDESEEMDRIQEVLGSARKIVMMSRVRMKIFVTSRSGISCKMHAILLKALEIDCVGEELLPISSSVSNPCPHGEPFVSPAAVVETCSSNDQCPSGHWCHQVGFSTSGLCCPSPARLIHVGTCPLILPQLNRLSDCRFDCRADDECNINEKCCYDGCGLRCKEIRMIGGTSGGRNGMSKPEVSKPGVCPFFGEKTCTKPISDDECDGLQKCCLVGCEMKCLYPKNNSVCLHMRAALQMIGQAARIQCRPDGAFEEIQCDANHCWCVNKFGLEVEGTRSSEDIPPNCRAPRRCQIPSCAHDISCKFGMKKDSNGCDTCECGSPCDRVVCPGISICVPMPVACEVGPCPEVPRCVVNPCLLASPLLNESTAQLLVCTTNKDCVGTNVTAYCNHYKSDSGVCCPGREPRSSPGTCPPSSSSNGDCSRQCIVDAQCPLGQKCCFNGCGLSCVTAVFSAPSSPTVRIGECLNIRSLGAFCVQRSKEPECTVDADCPPLRKCCSDGCTKRCTVADLTTHCIHAHLAALAIHDFDSRVFVPQCDPYGEYVQIQSHSKYKWCVDKLGHEIYGKETRELNLHASLIVRNRDLVQYEPAANSVLLELLAWLRYRTDSDGCPLCECIAPCELFRCNAGFVCRMVKVRCYTKDCPPIPRCIPNACPSGEPLIHWADRDAKHLVECNKQMLCPAGYFCNRNGYEGRSFCCRGVAEVNRRLFREESATVVNRLLNHISQVSVLQKLGICPPMVLNPGCREECQSDIDCLAFAKCCNATCGSKCMEPTVTTACLQRLTAFIREQPHLPPPIQCEASGEFREIQCDVRIRQCWCVDSSGIEVLGTRTSSDQEMPHCKQPKSCAISCTKSNCTHGVHLDTNGCPRNDKCQCKNPCEYYCETPPLILQDFHCPSSKICALVSVQCDRNTCPAIPKCVLIPCQLDQVIKDIYGNALSCNLNECPRGECMSTIGDDVGVCCRTPEVTRMPTHVIPESRTLKGNAKKKKVKVERKRKKVIFKGN